jgi:RNA-directed DNA polymerase
MTEPTEVTPSPVAATSTQEGDVRARWAWTEPAVWTERMLTALEQGVKGGKWYSLIDKVWHPANLEAAWRAVQANGGAGGVDHQTVARFGRHVSQELTSLATALRDDRYCPYGVRRVYIPKPGSQERRPLGIPTVRDRVVQAALRQVLEPIFEALFAPTSYGFRPGRGCKDALREVVRLLDTGDLYIVDVDIRKYFDTIPHELLMARVEERIADGRVLALIRQFLSQGVMEQGQCTVPEAGTPQGGVISPLLANVYLNPLDHLLLSRGYTAVRYADDMVVLCRTREEAEAVLSLLRQWMADAGLALHPEKTRIVDMTPSGAFFDFLGYRFKRTGARIIRFPRPKSTGKLRDTIRSLTRRTNGHAMPDIVRRLNPVLRGWFLYFQHSHANVFVSLDGWVRMRLRSILRKRHHLSGRGRGRDHQRWPTVFFAAQGLFSLATAHGLACQSGRR